MPSASKQLPSSPSRLDSGHSFLLILVHPFPCIVAALATGIVGRLTQVSGQAEMKEVTHEQKESNQRLKVLTEEFRVLLAKNSGGA